MSKTVLAAAALSAALAAGPGWSVQATPDPAGTSGSNTLSGVACVSASDCLAVGSYASSSGTSAGPIIARWNGSSWSLASTQPSGAELNAVSCSSATACTAVGSSSAGVNLAERWNGRQWTVQHPPAPSASSGSGLTGVSCPSATDCMAIGFNVSPNARYTSSLAEQWNGTSWTTEPTPDPIKNTLNSVSCTSATACTAVGSAKSSGRQVALAERWNGTSWSVQSVPSPSGAANPVLSGVACTGAAACTAVGGYVAASGPVNLAETWNGTHWSAQFVPTPSGASAGEIPVGLLGVSCSAATACTAAGTYHTGSVYRTEAAAWNGSQWVLQSMPAGTGSQALDAISCPTATDCTAVGFAFHGSAFSPYATLAEQHT